VVALSISSSLTLHQLLRIMYVDQMTSLDRLFKFDQFDSPSKRKAIGELMLGISSGDLYEYRVRYQKVISVLESKIKEIKTLHSFLGIDAKTMDFLDGEINAKKDSITLLQKELDTLDLNENVAEDAAVINQLKNNYILTQKELTDLTNENAAIRYDISDSQSFVDSLYQKIDALVNSSKVITALSDVAFKYCPACFSNVNPVAENACLLCGNDSEDLTEEQKDPTFKIKKEIEFQISESNRLVKLRQEKLVENESLVQEKKQEFESVKTKLSTMLRPSLIQRNKEKLVLMDIGSLNGEIKKIEEQRTRSRKLEAIYKEREALQEEANKLMYEIEKMEKGFERELNNKKRLLSELTLQILHNDKDHEEVFRDGREVEFDFGEDKVSVDRQALFSASSMVYLKNAFRLSLFHASCIDSTFLYPRFLLIDNVEDKGMQPERSHKFQETIIATVENITVPHQIIYTTSMIVPQLEGSSLCVGPHYTDINKTLKF